MLTDGASLARDLVRERFPQARAAWLGGSVATGLHTASSDLDVTVLLPGPPAPFRTSTTVDGWPVEFFVQTEESLLRFCDDDRTRRRRPTTMRLVGTSIVLVDVDGSGSRLQALLHRMDLDGPPPSSDEDLEGMRYAVTDLLADVTDARTEDERLTAAAALLREAGDLLLAVHRRWSGSGKWLIREIAALDAVRGTDYAVRLLNGWRACAVGDKTPMRDVVLEVLGECGGPLFAGFHRSAPR